MCVRACCVCVCVCVCTCVECSLPCLLQVFLASHSEPTLVRHCTAHNALTCAVCRGAELTTVPVMSAPCMCAPGSLLPAGTICFQEQVF